jgi:hypothetical protein
VEPEQGNEQSGKSVSIPGRYVHTVWCDDIRQEIGNKPSFMGVFAGGILLPAVPAALSRLGVYTWVVSPVDKPIESLQLQVVRDDGLVLAEIKPEAPPHSAIPRVEGATRQVVVVGVNMGPVEIPEACKWFVVKVKADGDELEGPKLRITVNPASFAASMSGIAPVEVEAPASDRQ